MTLADKTVAGQHESLTLEFDLRHPPQKVWRALTDPALLAEWLLPTIDFKLERGAAFQLQGPQLPQWDGVVQCRVLEVEPQKKLSYAWVVGAMELDTVVTFTLTPTPAGTHLTLVQSGFKAQQKQNWAGARYGMRMMGERLVALLERTG